MDKEFPLIKGARTAMYVVGALLCLLVVFIPLGIFVFWRTAKAKVVLSPEGLVARNVFSTTRIAYADVARLGLMQVEVTRQGGMAGALARDKVGGDGGALHLIVRTTDGSNRSFMVSSYENAQDILDEVEQRVGKGYEVVTPGAAGAIGAKWP